MQLNKKRTSRILPHAYTGVAFDVSCSARCNKPTINVASTINVAPRASPSRGTVADENKNKASDVFPKRVEHRQAGRRRVSDLPSYIQC